MLLGPADYIVEVLQKVEAACFGEAVLYFKVVVKRRSQVKQQTARFTEQVAPALQEEPVPNQYNV